VRRVFPLRRGEVALRSPLADVTVDRDDPREPFRGGTVAEVSVSNIAPPSMIQ
jgi:hypothetical protein